MTSSTRASASSGVVLGGRRSCKQAARRAAKFKQAGMRCKSGLHIQSAPGALHACTVGRLTPMQPTCSRAEACRPLHVPTHLGSKDQRLLHSVVCVEQVILFRQSRQVSEARQHVVHGSTVPGGAEGKHAWCMLRS